MSHSRDDAARQDVDRLSPTVPIRSAPPRPADGSTDSVPAQSLVGKSEGKSEGKSVNRITPHLDQPPTPALPVPSLARSGQRIGDYEIVEELARGGMGVVYKARQTGLDRTVALKMVLRGDFARYEELVRFRTEAQAIARLHHPNLVSIFEIGDHDGLPFYAMEFLEGGTLSRRINKKRMLPHAAARLMLPLVQAIEYAHSRGIIHRDLKPSNILFVSASAPIDKNVPKITDFGVAKHMDDDSGLTRTGDILGTPSYMAPEQANGRSGGVGPAADVYSLGALLYELLTGRAPFVGVDSADTLLQLLNNEPTPVRKVNPKVPVDLETICLKCLEKDPAKRYASAALLAEDLRRFLADEPILARPVSTYERLRKWVRRSPVQATIIAAALLLTVVGVGSLLAVLQKETDRAEAVAKMLKAQEERTAEVQYLLADAELERGIALAEKNDVRRGMHWMIRSLVEAEKVADRPEAAALAEAVRYNLAYWGSLASPPEKTLEHGDWAWAVAFSADGKTALTGGKDNLFCAWDVQTGARRGEPIDFGAPVWAVASHPSGLILAGAGNGRGQIRVYKQLPSEGGRLEQVGPTIPTDFPIRKFQVSPDGRHVLVSFIGQSHRPDLYGGAALYSLNPSGPEPLKLASPIADDGFLLGQFSHDSKWIIFADAGQVHTFDVDRKFFVQPAWGIMGPRDKEAHQLFDMTISSDRKMVAVSYFDKTMVQSNIYLWKIGANPSTKVWAFNASGKTKTMTFSPDDRQLAISTLVVGAGSKELHGQVYVAEVHYVPSDFRSDSPVLQTHNLYTPLGFTRPVWAIRFHPSGRYFVTGCEDGTSRIWCLATGEPLTQPLNHEGTVADVAISPQGTHLLTASAGGSPGAKARLRELPDFASLPQVWPLSGVHAIAWQDDRHFVAHDQRLRLRRWDSIDRTEVAELPPLVPGGNHAGMWFNPQGIMREFKAHRMNLWDGRTGKKLSTVPDFDLNENDGPHFTFADHIALFNRATKTLGMYRMADNTCRGRAAVPKNPSTAFGHPMGRYAAIFNHPSVGVASEVKIWDLDMKELAAWKLPNPSHGGLFTASGDIIALRGDYQFRFFDVRTHTQIFKSISNEGAAHCSAFYPKADLLLYSSSAGQISCWHIASAKPVGRPPNLNGFPMFLSPRPDGTSYLAGGRDLHVVEWPHLAPKTQTSAWLKSWVENLTGMTFDSNDELTPLDPGSLVARRDAMR